MVSVGFSVNWTFLAIGIAAMIALVFMDYTWLVRLRHACFVVGFVCIAAAVIFPAISPNTEPNVIYHDGGSVSVVSGSVHNGAVLHSLATFIPAMLFLLGTAGFLYQRRRWQARDMALLLGLSAVSIFAQYLVSGSSAYALLLAVAELLMLLTALASSPQSPASKWRRAPVCVAATAAPLALGWALLPKPGNPGLDIVRVMLPGAILNDFESIVFKPNGLDNAITAAFKAYGWLFSIGVIVLFAALLTLMVIHSFRVTDSFGRLLALGICVWFGVRLILFALGCFRIAGSLSVRFPFISTGAFSYLTDMLLIGLFLSVWRRSSFMPRDTAPAAAVPGDSPAMTA
jgi:hypothetical protein